jgi:hypothetical protein
VLVDSWFLHEQEGAPDPFDVKPPK